MKIKRHRKHFFTETVAASDLAFLLIIYFLVIAGFNVNIGFTIDLPESGSRRYVYEDELISFEIDRDGFLFFRGHKYDFQRAENEIRAAMEIRPNIALLLFVDPNTPWQGVVSFVELAQKLEVDSFSFSLREET